MKMSKYVFLALIVLSINVYSQRLENHLGIGFGTLEKGFKNGSWLYYYSNNRKEIKYKVNYLNDTIIGEVLGYWENGGLKFSCRYEKGKINGTVCFYNLKGSLLIKAQFVDNILEGKLYEYYDSRRLKKELLFDKGKLNGLSSAFYDRSMNNILCCNRKITMHSFR